MNQIALGDPSSWLVLDGQSVAAPFRRAAPFFTFSGEQAVKEKIEITLSGTPAQIFNAVTAIDKVILRARAYALGEYAHPQYLRFQKIPSGDNFYAALQDIYIEQNPRGYQTTQTGSLLLTLHYTRPNYFDSEQYELPLTGRSGSDILGGISIKNHTDTDPADGSTLLIKASSAVTNLPAPLRLEITNTAGADWYRVLVGAYHHHTYQGEDPFFVYATDMTGGTQYVNAGAINGYFRTFQFTSSSYAAFGIYAIPSAEIPYLDGRTYRPILNLFNAHAYTDMHLRIRLMFGANVLWSGEGVYADPNYRYVIFPPVQLPPNQILREVSPYNPDLYLEGLREGGALASIDVDQLIFFPVSKLLIFDQFMAFGSTNKLIYDGHREMSNVRYGVTPLEAVSHIRQGGPLLVYPAENTRLFFIFYNQWNNMNITHTATVRAYYRPRYTTL